MRVGRPHPWLPSTPLCSLWTHQPGHCHPCLCYHRPFLSTRWWLHLTVFKTCLKVTGRIMLEATLFQYNIILIKDPIPNEDLLSYKRPGNLGVPFNGIQAVAVTSQVQIRNLPAFLFLYLGNINPDSTSLSGNKKRRGSEN